MRPQKAKYLIEKAMKLCLKHQSFQFLSLVEKELVKLLKLAVKDEYPHECDSYYGKDRSFNTLMYISDRWQCTGRIKWLLELSRAYTINSSK